MKISSAELIISAVRSSQYPVDFKPEFLLVGRSNVGKSSFINTLLNRKNLARTSSKPGKTQTLNFYLINDDFYFVDAPGYGFANVSKSLKENFGSIMENYLETRDNLKMVFMLVDFRHKPTDDDIMMYEYLKHYNIPVSVICTKCDKVSNNSKKRNIKSVIEAFNIEKEEDITLFSSRTRVGKDIVENKIDNIISK